MSRPTLRLLPGGRDNPPDREPVSEYVTVTKVTVLFIPPKRDDRPPRFLDTCFEVLLSNGRTLSGSGRSLRGIVPGGRHAILSHANASQRAKQRTLIEYE